MFVFLHIKSSTGPLKALTRLGTYHAWDPRYHDGWIPSLHKREKEKGDKKKSAVCDAKHFAGLDKQC